MSAVTMCNNKLYVQYSMSFGIKTWETWSGALNAAANALVDAVRMPEHIVITH